MVAVPGRTFRLIPSRFPPVAAFDGVAAPDDLVAVMELEGWTNDRLVPERLARLPKEQWVYGRPNASIVMASFLHASPAGNRFNGPELGAWYGAYELRTAVAEVAHHFRRELHNIGLRADSRTYRAYTARLLGDYEDLRGQAAAKSELYDPHSHAPSQEYGEARRAAGSDGLVYDSLRLSGGTNVVAYRPVNVLDVLQADHWRINVSLDAPPVAQRIGLDRR